MKFEEAVAPKKMCSRTDQGDPTCEDCFARPLCPQPALEKSRPNYCEHLEQMSQRAQADFILKMRPILEALLAGRKALHLWNEVWNGNRDGDLDILYKMSVDAEDKVAELLGLYFPQKDLT